MLTLDEVKTFLRIDADMSEDDAFLSSLIVVSNQFIINATHTNADTDSELFKLAQKMLILDWYENRGMVGKAEGLRFDMESILFQIKATTSDPA